MQDKCKTNLIGLNIVLEAKSYI